MLDAAARRRRATCHALCSDERLSPARLLPGLPGRRRGPRAARSPPAPRRPRTAWRCAPTTRSPRAAVRDDARAARVRAAGARARAARGAQRAGARVRRATASTASRFGGERLERGARRLAPLRQVRPRPVHRLRALRAHVRRGPGHVRARAGRARLRDRGRARHRRALGRLGLRRLRRLRRLLPDRRALGARPARPAPDRAQRARRPAATAASAARSTCTCAATRSRRSRPTRDAPVNRGHACVKGRFAHGFVRSPDRLTAPLVRRDGQLRRGELGRGARRTSAERLGRIRAEHGPRCDRRDLLGARDQRGELPAAEADAGGDRHATTSTTARASATRRRPPGWSPASGCRAAPTASTTSTAPTASCSPARTRPRRTRSSARASSSACSRGAGLVVVDPRRIELAGYADVHLQRPARARTSPSSTASRTCSSRRACVDEGFLAERTEGFEELRELLREYTPERVEELSGVPADDLRRAARLYGEAAQPGDRLRARHHRARARHRRRAHARQPGAADRQRRHRRTAAASTRCAARTTCRAPPTWARCPTCCPATSGRRRRGRAPLRAALGRDARARARAAHPGDVRRGAARAS